MPEVSDRRRDDAGVDDASVNAAFRGAFKGACDQGASGQDLREQGARGPGFALRRRLAGLAEKTWRETVTRYMPDPWLVAMKRGRFGLPVRPGRRLAASR